MWWELNLENSVEMKNDFDIPGSRQTLWKMQVFQLRKANSRNKDEGKLDSFEDSVKMILGTKGQLNQYESL